MESVEKIFRAAAPEQQLIQEAAKQPVISLECVENLMLVSLWTENDSG